MLQKYLVIHECSDAEQYDKLPDDIVWDDDETTVFAWDNDRRKFVQVYQDFDEVVNEL